MHAGAGKPRRASALGSGKWVQQAEGQRRDPSTASARWILHKAAARHVGLRGCRTISSSGLTRCRCMRSAFGESAGCVPSRAVTSRATAAWNFAGSAEQRRTSAVLCCRACASGSPGRARARRPTSALRPYCASSWNAVHVNVSATGRRTPAPPGPHSLTTQRQSCRWLLPATHGHGTDTVCRTHRALRTGAARQ